MAENEARSDIEKAIVGSVLMNPKESTAVCMDNGVKQSWFENPDLAVLYEAARQAFENGTIEQLDALSIADEALKIARGENWKREIVCLEDVGRVKLLDDLIQAAAMPGHLEHHISTLRGTVYQRSFVKAFQTSMKYFLIDPVKAISDLITKASETYTAMIGKTTVSKGDICAKLEEDEYMSWHMRVDPDGPRDLNWVPGLRTPWNILTRIFLGIGARFHIWAARPSVGKTSVAINFIRYWADDGKRVLVNSLDMPPEDIIDRLRTEYSRVSIEKKRFSPTEKNLAKLKEASEWVVKSPIEVSETYYVEDLCIDIATKAKTGKVDVVVIDYVQLLNSYKVNNADEYQRVSYVAEYLKKTANRFKVPIIALCQLNRKSGKDENAEPTLTDLRGSGALEQAASTVVLLDRDWAVVKAWHENPPYWFYKDEAYGRDKGKTSIDPIWFIVAKNQNGPTGRVPFVVNKPYFTWKLGDVKAAAVEHEEGYGATKRTVRYNGQKFARIHRDWRNDSWEQSLDRKTLPYAVGPDCAVPVIVEDGE